MTTTNMENVNYGTRDLPVETVVSADGSTIAYEKSGAGPSVIIVSGGLSEKGMHAELAERLSAHFTVYNYDRRGRGASSDLRDEDYSVTREIEDLAAVINVAGEPSYVYANCTGSMIAVPAAAQGIPMGKLAVYEPPYGGPKVPAGYMTKLTDLLRQDRRTDAVALFLKEDALFTDEEITFLKTHPIWPAFEAIAPSMVCDSVLSDDADVVPTDQLADIKVPTLVLGGDDSPSWMTEMCQAIADGIPQGSFTSMQNAGHLMDDALGAELLTDFFLSDAPVKEHTRHRGAGRSRLALWIRSARAAVTFSPAQ